MKSFFCALVLFSGISSFAFPEEPAAETEKSEVKSLAYYLDKDFYQIADRWARDKEDIGEDQLVKLTIEGLLAAIGIKLKSGETGIFLLDPRKGFIRPLLYLTAPESVHRNMEARHLKLTGTKVEVVTPKDLKFIEAARKQSRSEAEDELFSD